MHVITEEALRLLMRVLILLAVSAVLIEGCTYINRKLGVEDNWWAEEAVEAVIEDQTGISIDLTPSSPEEKKDKVEFPFFDW